MIELKLLVKLISPFALLNLALNVKVETSGVLRVNDTDTLTNWLHNNVPGLVKFDGSVKMIDTN